MTVEVTADELKQVLQDSDVVALVIQKLTEIKTEGLADAVTTEYKSLGIITDDTTTDAAASTADSASDESATDSTAASS